MYIKCLTDVGHSPALSIQQMLLSFLSHNGEGWGKREHLFATDEAAKTSQPTSPAALQLHICSGDLISFKRNCVAQD